MTYKQKVVINNINLNDVIQSFHNYDFVKFLTSLQPVRINYWEGIKNDMTADFSFWFFGWKNIKVIHKNYHKTKEHLYFEDHGLEMPFHLSYWEHHHIIKPHKNGVIIIDKVKMKSTNSNYLIYLIMLFPVIIRRATYKIWFKIKFKDK